MYILHNGHKVFIESLNELENLQAGLIVKIKTSKIKKSMPKSYHSWTNKDLEIIWEFIQSLPKDKKIPKATVQDLQEKLGGISTLVSLQNIIYALKSKKSSFASDKIKRFIEHKKEQANRPSNVDKV